MVTFEGRNHTSHTVTQGKSMLGTSENVKWTHLGVLEEPKRWSVSGEKQER